MGGVHRAIAGNVPRVGVIYGPVAWRRGRVVATRKAAAVWWRSAVRAQGSIGLTTKNLRRVRMGFDGTIIWAYASGDGGTLLRSALTSGQWEALHAGTTDDLTGLDLRVDTQGSIDAWLTGRNARWGDSTLIRVR